MNNKVKGYSLFILAGLTELTALYTYDWLPRTSNELISGLEFCLAFGVMLVGLVVFSYSDYILKDPDGVGV
jgi:hypothetical protein